MQSVPGGVVHRAHLPNVLDPLVSGTELTSSVHEKLTIRLDRKTGQFSSSHGYLVFFGEWERMLKCPLLVIIGLRLRSFSLG